jgi:hypothetical protein
MRQIYMSVCRSIKIIIDEPMLKFDCVPRDSGHGVRVGMDWDVVGEDAGGV